MAEEIIEPRKPQDINNEYANVCAELGHSMHQECNLKKAFNEANEQFDKQLEALRELQKKATDKILLLEIELKASQEYWKDKSPVVPAATEVKV